MSANGDTTITIAFPREWLHIAADLLDKAHDEFARHSCNDYPLPPWMTPQERMDLDRAYHTYNGDADEEEPSDSPYGYDFCLMGLLSDKIREMAGPVPEMTPERLRAISDDASVREAARAAYAAEAAEREAEAAAKRAREARAAATSAASKVKR